MIRYMPRKRKEGSRHGIPQTLKTSHGRMTLYSIPFGSTMAEADKKELKAKGYLVRIKKYGPINAVYYRKTKPKTGKKKRKSRKK